MKKRIFALLLVAAMSFSLLAGCGSKTEQPETPDTPDTTPSTSAPAENEEPSFGPVDLAEFYNKIMAAAEAGPMMMDIAADAEMMEFMFPGLKDIETQQLVVCIPAMTGRAVEFVFVEVANAADVDAVKAILQARVDDQKTEGMGKYPTTVEVWQKHSEIVIIDNYVCLFVCEDKDGMVDAFRNGTEVPVWAKDPEAGNSAPAADMTDIYIDAIANSGAEMAQYNTTLSDYDVDMIEMILPMYGLTTEDVTDFATNFSMVGINAYFIMLAKPAEGCEQAVVDALNGFVEQKMSEFNDYLPEEYEIAKAALVETLLDGTVALVMCQGSDVVLDAIDAVITG